MRLAVLQMPLLWWQENERKSHHPFLLIEPLWHPRQKKMTKRWFTLKHTSLELCIFTAGILKHEVTASESEKCCSVWQIWWRGWAHLWHPAGSPDSLKVQILHQGCSDGYSRTVRRKHAHPFRTTCVAGLVAVHLWVVHFRTVHTCFLFFFCYQGWVRVRLKPTNFHPSLSLSRIFAGICFDL